MKNGDYSTLQSRFVQGPSSAGRLALEYLRGEYVLVRVLRTKIGKW